MSDLNNQPLPQKRVVEIPDRAELPEPWRHFYGQVAKIFSEPPEKLDEDPE